MTHVIFQPFLPYGYQTDAGHPSRTEPVEEGVLSLLLGNLGHAGRLLRRQPAFACVAILTLALGIGTTTAVFTIVDGVLLRPLPYRDRIAW